MPSSSSSEGHFACLRGLAVDPGVHVAFLPSQVLADAVGGQFPFAPFVADGAFGNCRDQSPCRRLAGFLWGSQKPLTFLAGQTQESRHCSFCMLVIILRATQRGRDSPSVRGGPFLSPISRARSVGWLFMNDQAYRPVMAPCDSKIIACLLSFCGLRCARRDLRPAAASRRGLNGP